MLYLLLTLAGAIPKPRDDRGATTAEYAMIVGGVALVIVFGRDVLRAALDGFYDGVQGDVDNWVP